MDWFGMCRVEAERLMDIQTVPFPLPVAYGTEQ